VLHFHICIQCITIWCIPFIILPFFLSPFLKMVLTSLSVPYSYMCRKIHQTYSSSLPSSFTTLPVVYSPQHDLFYSSVHHCLKCLFIAQWGFALVFYLLINCAIVSLTPLYYSSFVFLNLSLLHLI
jgi:hypothetical protein